MISFHYYLYYIFLFYNNNNNNNKMLFSGFGAKPLTSPNLWKVNVSYLIKMMVCNEEQWQKRKKQREGAWKTRQKKKN